MWLHDITHTTYRKMKVIDLERLLHSKKKDVFAERATESKDSKLEMKTSIKRYIYLVKG